MKNTFHRRRRRRRRRSRIMPIAGVRRAALNTGSQLW